MRHLTRWLAILIFLCAPTVVAGQGAAPAGDQVRGAGQNDVAATGSALPRVEGGTEQYARAQRLILVMLVTLMTAALIFGIATIAYAFRERRRR